jgi:hypothetical protein
MRVPARKTNLQTITIQINSKYYLQQAESKASKATEASDMKKKMA